MTMEAKITITVDHEHNCETWWDSGGREAWKALSVAAAGDDYDSDSITVYAQTGLAWLAYAATIYGWDEQPVTWG
jgi:hypothetical protein